MNGIDLEEERANCIAVRDAKLREIGLLEAAKAVRNLPAAKAQQTVAAPPPRPPRQPSQPRNEEQAPRRSGRARREVNYSEDAAFQQAKDGAAARPGKRQYIDTLTPEEKEERRQLWEEQKRARAAAKEDGGGKGPRGPRDSGKGVRIVGGKVYDSANGTTCHWCRHKTTDFTVQCTSSDCGVSKNGKQDAMPKSFCETCLRNRNGEDAYAAHASGAWICPACRVKCCDECPGCCNCGPCRKKADLEVTNKIMPEARAAGFDNAHDFLLYKETLRLKKQKKTQEELREFKLSQPWAAWMRQKQQKEEQKETAPAAAGGAVDDQQEKKEKDVIGDEQDDGDEENVQEAASAQVEVTSDGTDDEAETGEGQDTGEATDKVGGEQAAAQQLLALAVAAGGSRGDGGGGGRSREARKTAVAAPTAARRGKKAVTPQEAVGQHTA